MYLHLHDYKDGKSVLVNMNNVIRVQEHSERLGKAEAAHVGSRLLTVVTQGKGTSKDDPFPVDVRETVDGIRHIIENCHILENGTLRMALT